jgi:hypothetical protein
MALYCQSRNCHQSAFEWCSTCIAEGSEGDVLDCPGEEILEHCETCDCQSELRRRTGNHTEGFVACLEHYEVFS